MARSPDTCRAVRRDRTMAALLIVAHAAMLLYLGAVHSPTTDEPTHLASGLQIWRHGRFDSDIGNPPLAKAIAAIPAALVAATEIDGAHLVARAGPDVLGLVRWGRYALLPFSVVGGIVCWRWARGLYGTAAGLWALAIWVACPFVLSYGHVVTGDMSAAAMAAWASLAYSQWLQKPGARRAVTSGLLLGAAQLCKYVCLALIPLWLVVGMVYLAATPAGPWGRTARRLGPQLAGMLVLCAAVVNAGYGFQETLRPLAEFQFQSAALGPSRAVDRRQPPEARGLLSGLPVPLPAQYLRGLDAVADALERTEPAYLRGATRAGGWWYFYIYALSVKLPVGIWILALVAARRSVRNLVNARASVVAETCLLLCGAGLLAFISCVGTIQLARYALPAVPFLVIWVSQAAAAFRAGGKLARGLVGVAGGWALAASACVCPHVGAYFNEPAGGPSGGPAHLASDAVDWGQNVFFLKAWLRRHPQAQPLYWLYDAPIDPAWAGIEYAGAWSMLRGAENDSSLPAGWYVVNAERVARGSIPMALRQKPVTRVAYTAQVIRVDGDRANQESLRQ